MLVNTLSLAPLVLASGSRTRLDMLRAAGLDVEARPAAVDEDAIKRAGRAQGAPIEAVAEALAELKGARIAARTAGYVLGADQMLECDGTWFDKPADMDAARAQLTALSGRTHRLITCAVLFHDGVRVWHKVAQAHLTMRPLKPDFIDRYLRAAGPDVCASVGAYQLEGLGAQLFTRVDGDHFTILGLPLLPLLGILRARGALAD